MNRSTLLSCVKVVFIAVLLFPAARADAITRDRVMAEAKAFAFHPWRLTADNLTASCDAGYVSPYMAGDYVGLPYDWGGYKTLFQFDRQIEEGYGAGSPPGPDVYDCTTGLDCSGYVSRCWDTGHYTTRSIPDISTEIDVSSMLAGDVFNMPGYHVILFSHTLGSGEPVLYEATPLLVHMNVYGGWSYVSGYTPRLFNDIEGMDAGDPAGTATNPIVIETFTFIDEHRDTGAAASDAFDGCSAAPSTREYGPEYIYKVIISEPGNLTLSLDVDAGADIDIHLLSSLNTFDCLARAHESFTHPVDCGTYYAIADTYTDSGGIEYPGGYTLTAELEPTGGSCGSGPPAYDPMGGPGDACAYPGREDLPFCNPNLGVYTCLYSDTPPAFSFCSKICDGPADCGDFPGGCCQDIGSGEYYCMRADFCDEPPADDPVIPDTPDAAADPDAAGDPSDDFPPPDLPADSDDDSVPPDAPLDVLPDDEVTDAPATDNAAQDDAGEGCSCSMVLK